MQNNKKSFENHTEMEKTEITLCQNDLLYNYKENIKNFLLDSIS